MVLSKDIKLAICFGFICGCIISIFSVFGLCAEPENVDISIVNGLWFNGTGFKTNDTQSIGYIQLEKGYNYHFVVGGSTKNFCYTSTLAYAGCPFYGYFNGNGTFDISGNASNNEKYLYFNMWGTSNITITRTKIEGLTNFVDSLFYALSVGQLSTVFNLVVPILAISVLVGLGFYLLIRLLNRLKRAKGGA